MINLPLEFVQIITSRRISFTKSQYTYVKYQYVSDVIFVWKALYGIKIFNSLYALSSCSTMHLMLKMLNFKYCKRAIFSIIYNVMSTLF